MEFKKLQSDMVAAMKARDKARKDTISSLISAVKKLLLMKERETIFRKNW